MKGNILLNLPTKKQTSEVKKAFPSEALKTSSGIFTVVPEADKVRRVLSLGSG
jgi:hypothetical protein